MYIVYILRNPSGILYKGYTDNLEKRLEQHNSHDGFRSYTHGRGPWKLVYQEEYSEASKAKGREKFFKSGKGREYLQRILGAYPPKADG